MIFYIRSNVFTRSKEARKEIGRVERNNMIGCVSIMKKLIIRTVIFLGWYLCV